MTRSTLHITQNPGMPDARCSTLELGRIGPPGTAGAGAVDSVDGRIGAVTLADLYKMAGTLDSVADGATLTPSQRAVASLGSTLTLAPGVDVGPAQPVQVAALGGDLEVFAAPGEAIGGAASFVIRAGGVVIFEAQDATPVGFPAWVWNPVSTYGPQWDVPAWVGLPIDPTAVVTRGVGGAPVWAIPPAPPELPWIPVGRIYDVTDPQFAGGAVHDGVTDDSPAIDAACAAAALLPGVVFFPSVDMDAGEAYMISRRIIAPEHSALLGESEASIIRRFETVGSAMLADTPGGERTFEVADASIFTVGHEVNISSEGNFEWDSTHALIESIDLDANTITIDRDAISAYSAATGVVRTQFPMVTNSPNPTNDAAPATRGIRVQHLTLDGNAGPADPTNASLRVDFTNSTVHWERGYDCIVDDVHMLNCIADGYSDQARDPDYGAGVGAWTLNTIRNSHVHNSIRHGLHIGSNTSGAQIVGNRVSDCMNMAVFLCANAQHTVISGGNVFVNCAQGIAGSDVREADGDAVTDLTPLNDIRGDIGTVVTGNVFIGGPLSDQVATQPAIQLGAQGVASGNVIVDWNGGIRVEPNAVDCVVDGNVISLAPNYSGGVGVRVAAGAHRARVTNNAIRGGGRAITATTKQDVGVNVESADYVTITGNSVVDVVDGYIFTGDSTGVRFAENVADMVESQAGIVRIYGTLTDSSLDITSLKPSASGVISYIDGAGEAAQVRLLVNGVGDNGADDPAVAGEWNAISSDRYDGVIVRWNDGTEHRSQWFAAVGWIELSSGASTVDETDWHVIADEVIANNGDNFAAVDTTDMADVKVRVEGIGASALVNAVGVRMRFNGDTGANYFIKNSGVGATAWNSNGSLPGSLTNVDRWGFVEFNIALGGVGRYTAARFENTYWTSTGTSGSLGDAGTLYYTNTAAAITSLLVYDSSNAGWVAGARLTVWGRKAP